MDHNKTNLVSINPVSAGVLSKLSIETFKQAYHDVHSAKDMEAWCNQNYSQQACETLLAQKNVKAVIAYQNNTPSGFYVIKHHACPISLTGKNTELKQIYILADFYGLGLGGKLFRSAINQAISNGSDWLWLCVSNLNERALKFYANLGFEKIGTGPELIVGQDCLASSIMSLKLTLSVR